MAINPVSLAEALRPWRSAGVTHFLADVLGESDAATVFAARESTLSLGEEATSRQAPRLAAPIQETPLAAWPAHPRPVSPPEPEAPGDRALTAGHPHSFHTDVIQPDPRPLSSEEPLPRSARPTPERSRTAGPTDILPDTWPLPWRQVWAKTKPSPLVWTYPELGSDLLGQSGLHGAPRSEFLRNLIGSLRLPKGSSAFWPLHFALQEGQDTVLSASSDAHEPGTITNEVGASAYFQWGLAALRPSALVMLGTSCIADTGLELTLHTPFTQQIHSGLLCILLPEFAELLKNRALDNRCAVFLRGSLAGLAAFQPPQ